LLAETQQMEHLPFYRSKIVPVEERVRRADYQSAPSIQRGPQRSSIRLHIASYSSSRMVVLLGCSGGSSSLMNSILRDHGSYTTQDRNFFLRSELMSFFTESNRSAPKGLVVGQTATAAARRSAERLFALATTSARNSRSQSRHASYEPRVYGLFRFA
jgi:hypothetical protein